MRCPRCEADTPDGAKFCIECGAPLKLRCPQCGAYVLPRAKFCAECGMPLTRQNLAPPAPPQSPLRYTPGYLAEKILHSWSALEGECKQVTVLFADLKGSMELLAERDPEEAQQLLDPVLERMIEAVHRYEGTVNQIMGDGVMALFGAPIAHEDHAVRACYAALAMQEALRRDSEEVRRTHGITIQGRVGLNSGEGVVRAIGNDLHMDYSAIGQTTHLAARMGQLATPGSILLTVETLQLAEGFIQVKALGPVPVKGLAEPVEVGELVGASGIHRRLQAAVTRGLTRFVGRGDVHLELQRRLWQVGELPRMLDHLQHAERLATALDDQQRLGSVSSQMSFYCFLIGQHDRAIEAGTRALAIAKALADSPLEASHTRAWQAVAFADSHQERGYQASALRLLGDIHAHPDPPAVELAEEYYQQALPLAEELGMRPLQAHYHHGLGTLYAKLGRQEQACSELSTAIDLYRTMDMTFWLPQAEAALAHVEGP